MTTGIEKTIHTPDDIEHLVEQMGFLPFFWNGVSGFSLEEFTPRELWFPDEGDGVWEWKGPVIVNGGLAYGKFFESKAGFISMQWFPDFVNYRRAALPLTAEEEAVLSTLREHKSLLSRELRRLSGYVNPRTPKAHNPMERQMRHDTEALTGKPKNSRGVFDALVTRLQMAGWVLTADFEYNYDKQGRRYGWGVARYCTPEDFFGPEPFLSVSRTPEQSRARIHDHLRQLLPDATEKQLSKIIG